MQVASHSFDLVGRESSGILGQVSSRVKVAHLQGLLSAGAGGLASSIPELIRGLDENTRIESHVVGVLDSPDAIPLNSWGNLSYPHRSYGPANFHWAPIMERTLDRIAPEVIDSHGVWMNLSRVALKRHKKWGTPFIVTPHGMLDPWALRRSAWRKRIVSMWFENEHLARAGAIRALNRDEAKAIRQFGAETPIAIIPNGIEDRSNTIVTDVSDRPPILEFLGRLDPKKGLEPLLMAWSKVTKVPSASHWKLRLHGWGGSNYVKSLERLVSDLGIGTSVDLAGPVYGSERDKALEGTTGFILPSFSEGLPMSVLEAWSWGTPVLMTRNCNLPEGFTSGAAMEITTDPDDLARSMLDFIGMSSFDRRAMALAGRELVSNKFNARSVAKDVARLYLWLGGYEEVPADLMFDQ